LIDGGSADGMQQRPPSERSAFRREWNFALALVAAAAVVLLAAGYALIGTLASGSV
jgi:hypothetical protein